MLKNLLIYFYTIFYKKNNDTILINSKNNFYNKIKTLFFQMKNLKPNDTELGIVFNFISVYCFVLTSIMYSLNQNAI